MGSKRLPGKNKKILGGKPLFVWSTHSASCVPEICDILLSTDDPSIAKIAKKKNILIPWLRPKKLASCSASSAQVALHGLNWYEKKKCKVDGLLLLQPTSPFRTRQTIKRGIKLFIQHNYKTVIGVSTVNKKSDKKKEQRLKYKKYIQQKKVTDPKLFVNGTFYLIKPQALRKKLTFFDKQAVPLIIKSKKEAIDIDTIDDFQIAKQYAKEKI